MSTTKIPPKDRPHYEPSGNRRTKLRVAARRAEAAERQAAYDKLTTGQKIAKLDRGGFRAKRQRERLAKQA